MGSWHGDWKSLPVSKSRARQSQVWHCCVVRTCRSERLCVCVPTAAFESPAATRIVAAGVEEQNGHRLPAPGEFRFA